MFTKDYDDAFYQKHRAGSYRSAHLILSYINAHYPINSVIDYGCGIGTWCIAAKELGIDEVYGVDSNLLNHDMLSNQQIEFRQLDIAKPIDLYRDFDMAMSMEVGEHLQESVSDIYIKNLIRHTELVLFSAAVPGQEGLHHINEQPLSYWVEKFRVYDFLLFDVLRGVFWSNQEIEPWYRNNVVLFAHKSLVSELDRQLPSPPPITDIIHPELFERKIIKYKGRL